MANPSYAIAISIFVTSSSKNIYKNFSMNIYGFAITNSIAGTHDVVSSLREIFNYEKPYYNSMLQELSKGVKDVSLGDTSLGPWSKGTRRGS